jgi:hypothetical protein
MSRGYRIGPGLRTTTTVLPACSFSVCLLAAVAQILDKLTAIHLLAVFCIHRGFGRLTRAVNLGHQKASEDDLVEGRIGTAWSLSAHDISHPPRKLTGQELVEADQQLHVGVGRLSDLCTHSSIPPLSVFMLRPEDSKSPTHCCADSTGKYTYCGARLEHDGGQDQFPF